MAKATAAIVGRPNVGKSTLFNRLVGERVAIVEDVPGTTRDRIYATTEWRGREFSLIDTGGLDDGKAGEMEAAVRRQAEAAIREADAVLFVVDAQSGILPVEHDVADLLRRSGKPLVLAANKAESWRTEAQAAEFYELGLGDLFAVSGLQGTATGDLLDAIVEKLPPPAEELEPDSAEVRIAIVGRPNVGKSSLINSIVQSERAIVSKLPGTTRDAIDISYRRDGREFLFIDTAGIRRRGKRSSSVEVFSVMRAERSIRRADLCILVVDVTAGVTAQDKRIAGLTQRERKAAIIVLNKWDLIRLRRNQKQTVSQLAAETRARIFFLGYASALVASALTGEHVEKLFGLIEKIRRGARRRIGTGILNRLLRQAFEANPPPLVKGRRLKLFYAAQTRGRPDRDLRPPEFVLFVNDPQLLTETYRRYLEARIRKLEPYPGLPIILSLRAREPSHTRSA